MALEKEVRQKEMEQTQRKRTKKRMIIAFHLLSRQIIRYQLAWAYVWEK